jgi:DNA-binding transcriptional LysR family regulator
MPILRRQDGQRQSEALGSAAQTDGAAMDQLREMEALVRVARSQSFTSAARQLNVSRSTVTKIIAALEKRLGIRLLKRSTHHISLTPAGEIYVREASDIIERVERLRQSIGQEQTALSGKVRLGAPPSFAAAHLVEALLTFQRNHPDLSFDLASDDGSMNLIREGWDFTIRIAPNLQDTSLIAKLLVKVPQTLVASTDYLEARGYPQRPEDLANHECLLHSIKSASGTWSFNDNAILVPVRGSLSSNFGEVLRQAALQGSGISLHPTYMIHDDLRLGRLLRVLPEHAPESVAIYAVYPERQLRPKRVTEFLSFLADWLRDRADWQIS